MEELSNAYIICLGSLTDRDQLEDFGVGERNGRLRSSYVSVPYQYRPFSARYAHISDVIECRISALPFGSSEHCDCFSFEGQL
jgi:hypothetical protein